MAEQCYLNAAGVVCAAGVGVDKLISVLQQPQQTLTFSGEFSLEGIPQWLGKVREPLPDIESVDARWRSRNNMLAQMALSQIDQQLREMAIPARRIGVVIGTSTSGIGSNEAAIKSALETEKLGESFVYERQQMGQTAAFVAQQIGAKGPVFGISTACSSGAKALASARRLIEADICDVVVAGGVDSLCRMTVNGFKALEAISNSRCNPFSRNRSGINIGEGSALFLVSSQPSKCVLAGVGEGSDAHHISAPDPSGDGALKVMQSALDDAQISVSDLGYINLHGTGTQLNDSMEARAVARLGAGLVPASSTKPYTGHTLGASGAIEAAICWALLQSPALELPLHVWDGDVDTDIPELALTTTSQCLARDYLLSNSFAFGGNNIALVLGRGNE